MGEAGSGATTVPNLAAWPMGTQARPVLGQGPADLRGDTDACWKEVGLYLRERACVLLRGTQSLWEDSASCQESPEQSSEQRALEKQRSQRWSLLGGGNQESFRGGDMRTGFLKDDSKFARTERTTDR